MGIILPSTKEEGRPVLSICTIMKNEERLLEEFLDSVLPFTDDLVLVDTGSTDRSKEIAQRKGVDLRHFQWCDHFSKARNFSLDQARGDWILVLDVDDRILPETFEIIYRNLRTIQADAVYLPYISLKHLNWKETISEVKAVQTRLMLFRNHKGYHYQNPVHEKIDTVIEDMGGTFLYLDSGVYHLGYADDLDQLKAERNKKMILENYAREPGNPHYLHNYITVIWSDRGEVYELCKKAYDLCETDGQYLAAQRILQWIDQFSIEDLPDGKEESDWEGVLLTLNPKAAYVHLRRGRKFFENQDVENALKAYECAKAGLQFELSSLLDRREVLDRLGVLYAMKGRFPEALECFWELEKVEGRNAGTYHQILKVLFAMGNRERFAEEMQNFPKDLDRLPEMKKRELLQLMAGALVRGQESILEEFRRRCGLA